MVESESSETPRRMPTKYQRRWCERSVSDVQQGICRCPAGGGAARRSGPAHRALQLDQNDLPESMRSSNWAFAYRYGAVRTNWFCVWKK